MTDHSTADELAPAERDLFSRLPREHAPPGAEADRLVHQLTAQGFLRRRGSRARVPLQLAAAVALFAAGAFAGARYVSQGSLEHELARTDLTVADRVLLLQRAGSAYVTAAHAYADATATADSTAVEVATQVLRGAAHAVMKSNLNGTLSSNLVGVLQASAANPAKPILWY